MFVSCSHWIDLPFLEVTFRKSNLYREKGKEKEKRAPSSADPINKWAWKEVVVWQATQSGVGKMNGGRNMSKLEVYGGEKCHVSPSLLGIMKL